MTLTPQGRWGDLIKDLMGDGPTPNARCEFCDVEFEAKHPTRIYCSHNCRQKAWILANPLPPLPPLDCLICKAPVPTPVKQIGPRRKTCSDECRLIHARAQTKKYRRR